MRQGTRTDDLSLALHAKLRDVKAVPPMGLLAEDDVNALALIVPESTLLGALDLIDFQSGRNSSEVWVGQSMTKPKYQSPS